MFVFDTDAITHDQNAHPVLTAKVRASFLEQLFSTSITVEEQLKGRLAYINKHRNDPHRLAQGHAALVRTVSYLNTWNILLFDEEANALFRQLQRQRLRIGAQDLRIAAIALLHDFTVVTSNERDFTRVPGLKVEDWTATP